MADNRPFEFEQVFFRVHPPLQHNILFYSNGLAFYHGSANIKHMNITRDRRAAILNLIHSQQFSGFILP